MKDQSEEFNRLTDIQKHDLFSSLYNYMQYWKRDSGWVRYDQRRFVFFDSMPSFEDAFCVNSVEVKSWVMGLRESISKQQSGKKDI